MDNIKSVRFGFAGEEWEGVSEEGKGLLCELLRLEGESRLSARQVLAHGWCRAAITADRRLHLAPLCLRSHVVVMAPVCEQAAMT